MFVAFLHIWTGRQHNRSEYLPLFNQTWDSSGIIESVREAHPWVNQTVRTQMTVQPQTNSLQCEHIEHYTTLPRTVVRTDISTNTTPSIDDCARVRVRVQKETNGIKARRTALKKVSQSESVPCLLSQSSAGAGLSPVETPVPGPTSISSSESRSSGTTPSTHCRQA
jgi:hypothetical protein